MSEDVGHIEVTYRHKDKSDETFKKTYSLGDFKTESGGNPPQHHSNFEIDDMDFLMVGYDPSKVDIIVFNDEKVINVKVNSHFIEEIHLKGWNINYFAYHNSKTEYYPIEHNNIKYIGLDRSNTRYVRCFDLPPYTKMKANEEVMSIIVSNVVDILNLENVIEQNPDVDIRLREPGQETNARRMRIAFGI